MADKHSKLKVKTETKKSGKGGGKDFSMDFKLDRKGKKASERNEFEDLDDAQLAFVGNFYESHLKLLGIAEPPGKSKNDINLDLQLDDLTLLKIELMHTIARLEAIFQGLARVQQA